MNKKFLDLDGLRALLVLIDNLIDEKTQLNMVSTIDANSTNQMIPGAAAVRDFVVDAIAGLTHLTKEVVPQRPNTGDDNVLYLVPTDKPGTYKQWMYIGGSWFDFGDTDIDLSGYWATDDLEAMTNAEIQDVFDDVMGV